MKISIIYLVHLVELKSLRYWMNAVGIMEEVNVGNLRVQQLSAFQWGKSVWRFSGKMLSVTSIYSIDVKKE